MHYTIHISYQDILSVSISLQELPALVKVIFPQFVVSLDLEDGVGVHTETVGFVPDLKDSLATDLVLREGSVSADLACPGVDQLVVMSVARGFTLQVDSVKQLQLEEVKISKYKSGYCINSHTVMGVGPYLSHTSSGIL